MNRLSGDSPGRAVIAGRTLDLVLGDPERLHSFSGFGRLAQLSERTLWLPGLDESFLRVAVRNVAAHRRLARALATVMADA